jgi:DNA-binding transcriptional regulator YhcF (GntR family)
MTVQPDGHRGITAFPTWLLGQASPIELAVLLAIQEAPQNQISLSDMASRAGVCRRTVSTTLRKLEARGWLTKQTVITHDGANGPNRYVLKSWKPIKPLEPRQPRPFRTKVGTVPVELLNTCVRRKGVLFVYVILQTFEAPSICTLAVMCGMSPEDVRRSLRWLEEEGWIQQIQRPGSTSQFRVFFKRIGAYAG